MNTSQYQPVEVEKGFWRIEDGGVRCFLIEGEHTALLVDTGFGTGDLHACVKALTRLPLLVINTHADRDHTGCNGQFASVGMNPSEFDYYRYGKSYTPVPLTPLWEGQVLELGGRRFTVLLIPGHTPGSIALYERESGILISGDSVQTGTVYLFGQGRNLPAYLYSLEKLQAMQHKVRRIFPSHGEAELAPEVITGVLEDARALRAGKLAGEKPQQELPCLLYRGQTASFYYQDPDLAAQ